jgi:hypothetical protein
MMSLRAYAKHRGTSPASVSRAVKSGRLRASVTHDHRRQPKIADVALADQEWAANTDHSRAPAFVKERGLDVQTSAQAPAQALGSEAGAPPVPPTDEALRSADPAGRELTLSEASAEEKRWKAATARQQYLTRSGELVESREVAVRWTQIATVARTKLLAVPSKAKGALPHLTHADVATIDDLIRRALEELADDMVRSAGAA